MKKFLAVLFVILLLIGIVVGIYLVRQQQTFKSKATLDTSRIEIVDNSGNLLTSASSREVKLRLIYVAATASAIPSASPSATPSASPAQVFPTHFRIANFQSGLEFAEPQTFSQNSQELSWRLSQGNGEKTVFVQFKINGQWQEAISSQINLNYTEILGPELGMQIDIRDQQKIPTQAQADLLKPSWVRFVYPCTDIINAPVCPDDWHKTNLITSIPNPAIIRRLAIINGETAWGSPVGSTDVNVWKTYINDHFLPVLKQILQAPAFIGIELWNEEDHNSDPNVQPYIPPQAFAYLLKSSSALIRSTRPFMDIVVGGVLNGPQYLKDVKVADPDAFSDVDAIGVHPYVIPEQINDITTIINTLKQSNASVNITQPIWVTETGVQEFTHSITPKNQKEFIEKTFDQLVLISPPPQVVNWYAFTDLMGGSDGSLTWGLVREDGTIKPAGEYFKVLSSIVTPSPSPVATVVPTPTAQPSASATPTQVPSPTPAASSKPSKNKDLNGDKKVNSLDISILYYHWGSRSSPDLEKYDLNEDGRINSFDFIILKSNF